MRHSVPAYRTNIATFEVPPGWRDQSITAFRLPPAPQGGDASFVMTHDPDKGAVPFAQYFDRQADSCAQKLPDYQEVRRELIHVHDRDAAWLEFRWTNERATMQLRQVYFDCGDFAAICTLTAAPADIAHHDLEWRRLMSGLRFDPVPAPPAFP